MVLFILFDCSAFSVALAFTFITFWLREISLLLILALFIELCRNTMKLDGDQTKITDFVMSFTLTLLSILAIIYLSALIYHTFVSYEIPSWIIDFQTAYFFLYLIAVIGICILYAVAFKKLRTRATITSSLRTRAFSSGFLLLANSCVRAFLNIHLVTLKEDISLVAYIIILAVLLIIPIVIFATMLGFTYDEAWGLQESSGISNETTTTTTQVKPVPVNEVSGTQPYNNHPELCSSS